MSRSIIRFLTIPLLVAIVGIATLQFNGAAVQIDDAHWTGYPLPPCFVNARDCAGHVLGTDENGRDVLARLIVGGRYSIGVALLALALEFGIAAALTGLTRYAGRIAGVVLAYLAEGVSAIPRFPLALVLVLIAERSLGRAAHSVPVIALLLSLVFWPRTLRIWTQRNESRVDPLRHAASDLVTIVLLGAAVDFLGWGIYPPAPSWGNMLVGTESNWDLAWWASVFPAVCIVVTVLLIDALRFSGWFRARAVPSTSSGSFDRLTMTTGSTGSP